MEAKICDNCRQVIEVINAMQPIELTIKTEEYSCKLHLCNGCFYRAFPHLAGLFTLPFPVEEVNEETASRRLRREIDEIHALRKLRTLGKI
jgi:hypothetical protein